MQSLESSQALDFPQKQSSESGFVVSETRLGAVAGMIPSWFPRGRFLPGIRVHWKTSVRSASLPHPAWTSRGANMRAGIQPMVAPLAGDWVPELHDSTTRERLDFGDLVRQSEVHVESRSFGTTWPGLSRSPSHPRATISRRLADVPRPSFCLEVVES